MITATLTAAAVLPADAALALTTADAALTRMGLGRVSFSNARYGVDISAAGTVQVTRLDSGDGFLALGLPSDPDGPIFDFYGFATLLLQDGTKVTVHTAPRDAATLLTLADRVLIVSGDYGVEVQGLGGAADALCYVETRDFGWLMDAVVPDGVLAAEDPQGGLVGAGAGVLWQPLDLQTADPAELAPYGALATPAGQALLLADGVQAITFMGSFQGAPAFHLRDPDDTSGTGFEQHRLSDQEAVAWRLCLARQGGRVRAWAGVPPQQTGVHPSWGAPGWQGHRPAP